jgi:hypothetical protein
VPPKQRKLFHVPEYRSQKPVQPREWQARLGLNTRNADHQQSPIRREPADLRQQSRLPDTGLASHHQGPTSVGQTG